MLDKLSFIIQYKLVESAPPGVVDNLIKHTRCSQNLSLLLFQSGFASPNGDCVLVILNAIDPALFSPHVIFGMCRNHDISLKGHFT